MTDKKLKTLENPMKTPKDDPNEAAVYLAMLCGSSADQWNSWQKGEDFSGGEQERVLDQINRHLARWGFASVDTFPTLPLPQQEMVFSKKLIEKITPEDEEEGFNWSGRTFHQEISIKHSRKIQYPTGYLPCAFFQTVNFSHCTFSQFVTFTGVTFAKDTAFASSIFEKKAHFQESTFAGKAHFQHSTFEGEAMFLQSTFKGEAGFEKSTFKGDACFYLSTFEGEADFTESTFEKKADFLYAIFGEKRKYEEGEEKPKEGNKVLFQKAKFLGVASFESSTFKGKVDFTESTFEDEASFLDATFEKRADFWYAIFGEKRKYEEGEEKPTEGKKTLFQKAKFLGAANFRDTYFAGKADFKYSNFKKEANFLCSKFNKKADFFLASIAEWITFNASTFFESLNLASAKCNGAIDFSGTTFHAAPPTLTGLPSDQRIVFTPKTTFSPPEDREKAKKEQEGDINEKTAKKDLEKNLQKQWEAETENWRILKQLAHSQQNDTRARTFFAHELYARCRPLTCIKRPSWILTQLYGGVSGHGWSVVKPAMYWCLLFIVFYGIYMYCDRASYPGFTGSLWGWWDFLTNASAATCALTNNAFLLHFDTDACAGLIEENGYMQFFVFLQRGLSLVLLFLIGLGARNYFRIRLG